MVLSLRARLPWRVFPWWLLGLYRRPGLAFTLLLLGPLSVLWVWCYATSEHQWRAREGRDLTVAAQLACRIITDELSRLHQLEASVAARPEFISALIQRDRSALRTHLRLLVSLSPALDRVVATDATGHVLAEAAASPASAAASSVLPDAVAPPDTLPQHGVSAVYLYDATSGEKAVGITSPIREGSRLLGMVQGQVRLGDMARWLEKIRLEPSGFVYVVDHQGFLVTYPFQLLPGRPKDVSGWPAVRVAVPEDGAVIRFSQGHPPNAWTAAVMPLAPFGWRVIAQQPDAAMLAPLRQLVSSLSVIAVVLIGAVSVILLRWAHLHRATLRLLAQQSRLLKSSERRHVLRRLRRARPEASSDSDAHA